MLEKSSRHLIIYWLLLKDKVIFKFWNTSRFRTYKSIRLWFDFICHCFFRFHFSYYLIPNILSANAIRNVGWGYFCSTNEYFVLNAISLPPSFLFRAKLFAA